MLNAKILVAVDRLLPLLRQFPRGEYGLAVGGAHAKQTADHESDLDLYVFAGEVLPNPERTRLAREYHPDIREVVSWGVTEPFEGVGTDFYLQDLKVECWLRNTASIEAAIDECAAGIVKRAFVTWTTTGFYNHCCLSDLDHMLPIDDPAGILGRWKSRIRDYPAKLRTAIIGGHLAAARFWPHNFHYSSAVERQDLIYTSGIIQQVVHNLIQVLFAANEVYFPGDKKLSEAILQLDKAPDQFSQRVERLLFPAVPASLDTLRSQQRELQDLLKAVESICTDIYT